MRISRSVAIATGGVALGGALGIVGIAGASTSQTPTPTASGGSMPGSHGRQHAGHRDGLGRALHGEATVKGKDGTFKTVDAQRGVVTAVSPSSISLKSADGYVGTYVVSSATKVHKGRTASTIGDVKVGDTAAVIADKANGVVTARSIAERDPNAPKQPRAGKPSTGATG